MSDLQEHPGPTPAALAFLLVLAFLFPLLYGYLLALSVVPGPVVRASPALPALAGSLLLFALLYAFPHVRRAHALGHGLRAVAAVAVSRVLPPRLVLVSPWAGLRLPHLLARRGGAHALLEPALTALVASLALAFTLAEPLRRARRPAVASIAHGSARWATRSEVDDAGLLADPAEGVHLGYLDRRFHDPLSDPSDQHILVLAPPGTGKTTAIVIPTLLRYRAASAWVLDPKGELWSATAAWRRRRLGHRCIRFAPSTPGTPAWNPLLEIPIGPGDLAAAAVLGQNLVVASASEGELHWTRAARSLWTLLALHVRYAPNVEPTVAALRQVLVSRTNHDQLFDDLAEYAHDPRLAYGWLDPLTGEPSSTHPEVRFLARKFRATPPRERGSIVSTLQQYLDPWGDPQIARATKTSEFNLRDLLGSRRTTLYVSIPFHDLTRLAPLVRLQLAALARRLTQRPTESPHRLELVVDEFAALGRVPIMEEMLAFLRGYNARSVLLLQDLAQLRRLYGPRETIAGNCRVHLALATQSPETRHHASSLAGTTTARYRRTSRSHGGALGKGFRRTTAMTEAARPLLTEGEVGTLPLDQAVLFRAGLSPVRVWLRPYFADPKLLVRSREPARADDAPEASS